jgi:hypothetical protein
MVKVKEIFCPNCGVKISEVKIITDDGATYWDFPEGCPVCGCILNIDFDDIEEGTHEIQN